MTGLGDLIGGLAGGAAGGGGLDDVLEKLSAGYSPGGLGGMLAGLVPVVSGMLENGGLQEVLAELEASGLSAQARSWVGTGTKFDPANGAVPMKPGSFVTHFGNRIHWDGAKDEDVTLAIIGEGPVTTVLADQVK